MKKLLLGLFILISASPVFGMTLSELKDEVRLIIRDNGPTSSEYRYSDTQIERRINIACKQIMSDVEPVRKRYYLDLSTGTREYSLPSDFYEIRRVYVVNDQSTNTYQRISYAEIDKLDEDSIRWEDADNGQPTDYYIRYSTTGIYLGLYPEPDGDHAGTDYGRIDYIPSPNTLNDPENEPFFGLNYLEPYHDLIVYYTVYICQGSGDWLQVYKTRIQELKKELLSKPDKITIIKRR